MELGRNNYMKQTSSALLQIIAHRREVDGEIQTLECHLQAVGKLSARNASKLNICTESSISPVSLEALGEVLGLLHDLGKYSKEFQDYLCSAVGLLNQDADDYVNADQLRGRIDHSTAGAQFIWQKLSKFGPQATLCAQILALCIASHHSGLIDCITPDGKDNFMRRISKAEKSAHLDEALAKMDASVFNRLDELLNAPQFLNCFQQFVQSIVRLESNHEKSETVARFKLGLLVRFLFSCLIDADRVDTADFEFPHKKHIRHQGKYEQWDKLIGRLERYLESFPDTNPIDEIRREISLHCKTAAERKQGIFTLTVPTGGGKTLASLRFALHHAQKNRLDRVIYVIPFTSIIDQNADVVRHILEPSDEGVEPGSIVLEHHSNLTPEKQTWRSKVLSENWDAPIIYTTSVQLLETLFAGGTRSARRMHQLANSVIIFDEAQAIPLRCIHLFNNAINFLAEHCGSSVVLCTATQPLLNAVDPKKGSARFGQKDEIIPDVAGLFDVLKRTEVISQYRAGGWTEEEVAALACDEIEDCGSCLIIVNTRQSALNLYQACTKIGCPTVYHLSTSMCPAHRRHVLAEIRMRLETGAPTFCISTQLIEAGVDVDFGAVIRHVAGLDSIAQAAGRCNRNGKRAVGRVHLINPAEEKIDRLIDIRVGRDIAERVIREFEKNPVAFHQDLIGPKAMSTYFDYYFFQRANEMGYAMSAKDAMCDDSLLNILSENSIAVHSYKTQSKSSPPLHLRQAFMTAADAFRAIDAPTKGVIVPYGAEGSDLITQFCATSNPESQFNLLHRAQQFSVNVFPHVFDSLQRAKAIEEIGKDTGIYHLMPNYYSTDFGLSEAPTNFMETHCV